MMSYCANCLAIISILIIEITFLACAGYPIYLSTQSGYESEKKNYIIFGVIMILIFVLFNLLLFCFRKSIHIAIAVLDATADFFASTKRILLTPILFFFVTLIVLVLWGAGFTGVMGLNKV